MEQQLYQKSLSSFQLFFRYKYYFYIMMTSLLQGMCQSVVLIYYPLALCLNIQYHNLFQSFACSESLRYFNHSTPITVTLCLCISKEQQAFKPKASPSSNSHTDLSYKNHLSDFQLTTQFTILCSKIFINVFSSSVLHPLLSITILPHSATVFSKNPIHFNLYLTSLLSTITFAVDDTHSTV